MICEVWGEKYMGQDRGFWKLKLLWLLENVILNSLLIWTYDRGWGWWLCGTDGQYYIWYFQFSGAGVI